MQTSVLTAIVVSFLFEEVWCQWDKYRGAAFGGPGRPPVIMDSSAAMSPMTYNSGNEYDSAAAPAQGELDCAFIMQQCQCDSPGKVTPRPQPKGAKGGKGGKTNPATTPAPAPTPQQQQMENMDYRADYPADYQ